MEMRLLPLRIGLILYVAHESWDQAQGYNVLAYKLIAKYWNILCVMKVLMSLLTLE